MIAMTARLSRRAGLGAVLVAAAVGLAAEPTPCAQVLDQVLAVVNGEIVTWLDVRAAITFQLVTREPGATDERDVIDALIERALMLADAGRYAVREPDQEQVDRRVEAIRARFPTRLAFEAAVSGSGLSEGRLETWVRDSIRLEAHIEQRFAAAAQPTEDEVTRYYRQHQTEFTRGDTVPPLDRVRDEVTARVAAERMAVLVSEWVGRLRQRAEIRRAGDAVRRR